MQGASRKCLSMPWLSSQGCQGPEGEAGPSQDRSLKSPKGSEEGTTGGGDHRRRAGKSTAQGFPSPAGSSCEAKTESTGPK